MLERPDTSDAIRLSCRGNRSVDVRMWASHFATSDAVRLAFKDDPEERVRASAVDGAESDATRMAFAHDASGMVRSVVAGNLKSDALRLLFVGDAPFVATDNMQALAFDTTVSPEHREVIAASLSSAFGAKSALYRSNEVGCEGVRWLSTANLQGWFALNPTKISESDAQRILDCYRRFRRLKTSKIYEMSPSAITVWTELTSAVAAAAGAINPEVLAERSINEAKTTTLRRREREILATSGRTRAGSSGGGKLLRDVKKFVESVPEFLEAVRALSDGEHTLRIKSRPVPDAKLFERASEMTTQRLHVVVRRFGPRPGILNISTGQHGRVLPTTSCACVVISRALLFDIGDEIRSITVCNELASLLGEGFEAAPIMNEQSLAAAESLLRIVRGHFIEASEDGEIPVGFEQIASSIDLVSIKQLQAAVRKQPK